jgi:molybdenum cofactor cytidylyltransferase
VLLVLGSRAEEIQAKISISAKTRIVINSNFKEGMSSSVKCGIQNTPENAAAFLLLLGDQPFISAEIIDQVISSYQTAGHGIVRPVYKGGHGHPIIFNARYRRELLTIGEGGAKVVVNNHLTDIYELPLDIPEILTDIDTPLDYQNAVNRTKPQK